MTREDVVAAIAPDRQAARRAAYLAQCRAASLARFAPDGSWLGPGGAPSFRERMWHCLALLPGEPEAVARANRVLETSDDSAGDFTPFTTALVLRLHGDRLTSAARELLWRRLSDHVDHAWDHIFRYTENCAALNVFALWEYATATGERRYAERAAERLAVFAEERRHCGASHEFVSINYLPVFMTGVSALARWCPEPDSQALAAELEEKIWRELAVCWHPRLGFTVGPSGRSYTQCSLGLSGALEAMVHFALGEAAAPAPASYGLFAEGEDGLAGAHDLAFLQSGIAQWCAAVPQQLSAETAALFYAKRYPNRMTASVQLPGYRENVPAPPGVEVQALGGWWAGPERGFLPGTIFHPGGRAVLSTYQTEDYGVGASTRILYTQCDFLRGLWRSAPPAAELPAGVARLQGRRALYVRYLIDDQVEEKLGRGKLDLVSEQGRGGALQSGPLAVAWYAGGEVQCEGIRKLRTCALVSEYFHPLEEVWIGDQRCPELAGTSAEEEWVFLQDGSSYVALRPLRLTNHGRAQAVAVSPVGPVRVVSFYNYDGPPRDFLAAELRQTAGGLVYLMGSEAEHGDFAAFRRACRTLELTDYTYESQRRIRVAWGEHSVDLLWDMQSEELLLAQRNGQFLGEPYLEYSE